MSPGLFDQCLDNLSAKSLSLVLGMHGYIADIGTISTICQGPTDTDKLLGLVDKAFNPAVAKHDLQIFRSFIAQWRNAVKL